MKALTNILTHLLMLLMLFIVACTEETAEVDNLSRGEQYVTVRMNIPGMTAATTRAADGAITSVTALSFNSSDQLLDVKTVNTINNVNANNGYNGNFNLTVPNGTQTIHFLANLPLNYSNEQTYVDFLKAKKGQSQVDVMTSLTTTDYNNLVYWGMTTYDGSNSTLSTTLYRNMAKISIKPSVEDVEFNQFTQEQLIIMGLDNPNTSGTLIPYNNGFHNTGVAPTYLTLPNGVTTLDKTPVGNEGAGYGYSLYVFEHANSNYMDKGLFVFCKIGDAYYSVALTRDGINPYEIKRNHEYIIYVSDVDDYQTNDYRAESYDALFDGEGKTVKKPINLEVKEVAQVAFSNTNDKTIDWNNGNPNSFDVAMSNIAEGTVTLTIAAEGFQVTQGGNELQKVEGNYTYTGSNTTFTFKPTIIGSHQITITGSGQYATVPSTTINVTVQASIKAEANKAQLYYDSNEEQTVTVNVTIPTGVKTLNISATDFIFGEEESGRYTYAVNSQTSAALSFKLKSGIQEAKPSTITISDASGNATQASVSVSLISTPVVTFSYTGAKTITLGNSLDVVMTVPYGKSLSDFRIEVTSESNLADFVVTQDSTPLPLDDGVYTTTNVSDEPTFTFTPSATGTYTITFSGSGTDVNMPAESDRKITLTVKEAPAGGSEIVLWGDDEGPQEITQGEITITTDNLSGKTVYFEITMLVDDDHAEIQVLDKWGSKIEEFSTNDSTLECDTENSIIISVEIPAKTEGLGLRVWNIKLIKVYYYSTE